VLGLIGLVIMGVLSLTSFDYAVDKLGLKKWKMLHRFIYVGLVLIMLHIARLGSHFADLYDKLPQIVFLALLALALLESIRIYVKNSHNLPKFLQNNIVPSLLAIGVIFLGGYSYGTSTNPFNYASWFVHSRENAGEKNNAPNSNREDAERFNLQLVNTTETANNTTEFSYRLESQYGAKQVKSFVPYAKGSGRVYILADDFSDFITSTLKEDDGILKFDFKVDQSKGYRLYFEIAPLGFPLQTIGTSYNSEVSFYNGKDDLPQSYTIDGIDLELTRSELSKQEFALDQQRIQLNFKDSETGEPFRQLQQIDTGYTSILMVNERTFENIVLDPVQDTFSIEDSKAGPFLRYDLDQPVFRGTPVGDYRVFIRYKAKDKEQTVQFKVGLNNENS